MINLLIWLATYLLHSTLFLIAVYVITRYMKHNQLRLQNALWKTAVFAGIFTAGLQTSGVVTPLSGTFPLPISSNESYSSPESVYTHSYSSFQFTNSAVNSRQLYVQQSHHISAGSPVVKPAAASNYLYLIPLFWLLGMIYGIFRLLFHQFRLRQIPRKTVNDFAIQSSFQSILNSAEIKRTIRLTQSQAVSSPIVLSGSEICLPERVITEMSTYQQRSVLAHELSHIIRRDTIWFTALALVEAAMFFQPLNRLARKHIRTLTEYSCDDWAIDKTGRSIDLARCLANVANWTKPRPIASHVPAMASGALKKRVSRALDDSINRTNLPVLTSLGITTGLIILLCFSAPSFTISPIAKNTAVQVNTISSTSKVTYLGGNILRTHSEQRVMIYVPQVTGEEAVKPQTIIWH